MERTRMGSKFVCCIAFCIVAGAGACVAKGSPGRATCEKVLLLGEVSAGAEWKAALGEGWIFRLIPIQPGSAGYSGWDLVVDREAGGGYPDALLLATPPYHSINEREVGTTFGVRAQDAIGWNPRSFHFLTDVAALSNAQKLFRAMDKHSGNAGFRQDAQVAGKLMEVAERSATGQFRILNARITPGVGDVAPFAQAWAAQSAKTPHELDTVPATKANALGSLNWIRFSVTLWLPQGWKSPHSLAAVGTSCSQ